MSRLNEQLAAYIATRRALGSKISEPARTLRGLVDLIELEGGETITTPLALRWATESVGVQPSTWARKLGHVRGFAAWLSVTDPRTEIPPRELLCARHRRKTPHIFTDQEIGELMAGAARLASPKGLRAVTYRTLIGLLAATGLRPGEALALNVPDVDLVNGILSIRWTKFGKSRFVPVEESTRQALAEHAEVRDRLCLHRHSEAFFVSESRRGARLGHSATRRTFAILSQAIGLRVPPVSKRRIGRGPRLQDLRHTFATSKLIEWYRVGLDVERMIPGLMTYLGHASLESTYWYIQAVPELLQLASERGTTCSKDGI